MHTNYAITTFLLVIDAISTEHSAKEIFKDKQTIIQERKASIEEVGVLLCVSHLFLRLCRSTSGIVKHLPPSCAHSSGSLTIFFAPILAEFGLIVALVLTPLFLYMSPFSASQIAKDLPVYIGYIHLHIYIHTYIRLFIIKPCFKASSAREFLKAYLFV